ncbi:hypothetical protein HYU16_02670 [Candidatus Woesearchaeota archaeon]|nr:hypothetical protein [Candidatus Woesearchaeota archaeon]
MRNGLLASAATALSLVVLFVFLMLFALPAHAHGTEADEHDMELGEKESSVSSVIMLDEAMRQGSLRAVFLGTAALAILVAVSVLAKRKSKKASPLVSHLLFWSIVVVVVAVTAYVAGSTIYLNAVSKTSGPVHWHADFEVWRCGEHLELVDPEGLSNRVGSSVLHEHGDNRMHIEGVVVDFSDVSIGSFFRSVGGDLHPGVFSLPTDSGIVTMRDGDSCPGEAGMPGTLQVFVYKAVDGRIVQEKLGSSGYEGYAPSPFGNVPPGDCIVFEFDPVAKDKTERMCESYEVALKRGALNGS